MMREFKDTVSLFVFVPLKTKFMHTVTQRPRRCVMMPSEAHSYRALSWPKLAHAPCPQPTNRRALVLLSTSYVLVGDELDFNCHHFHLELTYETHSSIVPPPPGLLHFSMVFNTF